MLLCDSHRISIHQTGGCCEASLQCRCDPSVAYCEELLLLFSLFNVTYPSLYSRPTHIHSSFKIPFKHSCVADSKLKD